MPCLSFFCSGTPRVRNAAWGNVLGATCLRNCKTIWEMLPAYCCYFFFFLTVNSSLNPQCFAVHFHDSVETLLIRLPEVSVLASSVSAPFDIVAHSSFFETFVLLALRLFFHSLSWGPLVCGPGLGNSPKLLSLTLSSFTSHSAPWGSQHIFMTSATPYS